MLKLTAPRLIHDHELIEQELLELETIISTTPIHYPNFIHTLKKLTKLWDAHEKSEERFFQYLHQHHYGIPYESLLFEHGELRAYKRSLEHALKSRSEHQLRMALEQEGNALIWLLRQHMAWEDEVLLRLPQNLVC